MVRQPICIYIKINGNPTGRTINEIDFVDELNNVICVQWVHLDQYLIELSITGIKKYVDANSQQLCGTGDTTTYAVKRPFILSSYLAERLHVDHTLHDKVSN